MVEVFSTRDMRKNAAVAFASVDKDVNCEGEDVAKLSGHPVHDMLRSQMSKHTYVIASLWQC